MDSYQRKVELVGQLKQIAKSMESDLRASKRQNILDTVPKDTAKKMCAAFLKKNMSPVKLSDIVLPKSRNNKTVKSNNSKNKTSKQRFVLPPIPKPLSYKSPTNKTNNITRKSTKVNNTTRKSTKKRPNLLNEENISRRMKLPCPPGQVRGPKGYCRKAEYATKNYNKDKPCKEGKVKGPKGYCRKVKNINVTYKKKNPNQKTRNVRKNVTKKVRISNEDVKIPYEDIGQRGEETPNNYSPMKENPRNISPVSSLSNVSNENLDRMLKKDYTPVKSPSNVSNNEWNEMIPARYKDLVN